MTIAALYVETDGCYFGLPGVDPWDEARDARLYAGPWQNSAPRIGTPEPFRDLLISIVSTAKPQRIAA